MSTYGINVPAPDDIDYHAARQQQRLQAALKALDVGEVLSLIDSHIAAEPDPQAHPCFGLVNWLLDKQLSVDGGAFWDAWKQLALQAIEQLVDEQLQAEG
jgi:hypothetical protein